MGIEPRDEAMSISAFPHESPPPRPDSVRAILGKAAPLWDRLAVSLEDQSGQPGVWKSYGPRYGWRQAYLLGKGPLAALYPQSGLVMVGVNLVRDEPDRATRLELGSVAQAALEAAPHLRDGKCLLIPVDSETVLADALRLIGLKQKAKP